MEISSYTYLFMILILSPGKRFMILMDSPGNLFMMRRVEAEAGGEMRGMNTWFQY